MARFVIPHSNHPQAINVRVDGIHYVTTKTNGPNSYHSTYLTVGTGENTFTGEPVAFNIDSKIQDSWLLWRKINNRKNAAQAAAKAWVKKNYDNVKLLAPIYWDVLHTDGIDYASSHPTETWMEVARAIAYNMRFEKHLVNSVIHMTVAPADFDNIPVYSELSRYEDDFDKALGMCPFCGRKPRIFVNHGGQWPVAEGICTDGFSTTNWGRTVHPRWSKALPSQFNPYHPAFSHPDAKQKLNDIYAGPKVQVPQLQVATI